MFLIVGLGNPGDEYASTRHNAGFMAADALYEKYGFAPFRSKFDALIAEGKINGEKVFLLKPQTQNVIVFHDDLDLPVGKLKAKIGGGAGGHNGLKSIDAAISPNYNRIRIGVGHPQGRGDEVVNYVLGGFAKADKALVDKAIEIAIDALPVLLEKGMPQYSNELGIKLRQ